MVGGTTGADFLALGAGVTGTVGTAGLSRVLRRVPVVVVPLVDAAVVPLVDAAVVLVVAAVVVVVAVVVAAAATEPLAAAISLALASFILSSRNSRSFLAMCSSIRILVLKLPTSSMILASISSKEDPGMRY